MAVPKAKKPKKKQHTKPELLEVIKMTQYLDLAVMARALQAKGWKKSSIESFIKFYGILYQELRDRRQSPWGMIDDCSEMVGIDIPEIFNTILES